MPATTPIRRPESAREAVLLAVCALLAVGLPAAGAPAAEAMDCPQFRCSADHAGNAASSITSENVGELAPSWSLRTGDRVYGSPAVADGILFVPSEDGHVYAVDAATGAQRWAYRTDGGVWSTPAVADGTVYFGSADEHVYAVDAATGELRWKVQTGGDISASPAVADGVVYAGSNDHHLYALDAATGDMLWAYKAGERVSSSPAVAQGTVYVGSNDRRVHAVDAASGEERWTFQADGWVWSGPTIADGRVLFTSNGRNQGRLYALDATSGEQLWQSSQTTNGFGSPVVAGDVVVASSYTAVRAHNVATGAQLWSYSAPGYMFVSPFITNDLVLAINSSLARAGIVGPGSLGDGSLVALNLADGAVVHEVYFPRLDYVYSSPIAVGDQIFFGAGTGVLHSLSLPPAVVAGEIDAEPVELLPPYAHRDVLGDMLDPGSPAALRRPGDGVAKVSNSADPRGLNSDYYHFHGLTDDGRVILADVRGAGVLTDLYMYYSLVPTATGPLGPPLNPPPEGGAIAPTIAMYADDMEEPIFDMNAADFYRGGAGFPFLYPLVSEHSAAAASHVPVPFRERLLIVADRQTVESGFWYDFYYLKFPDARGVETFDPVRDEERYQALLELWEVDSPVPQVPAAGIIQGTTSIAPGETIELLDATEPGQVDAINILYFNSIPPVMTTPSSDVENDSRAAEPLRGVRIQARWDDREELSVDAPIGDFFGTGFGQAEDYDTLVNGMHTNVDVVPPGWPHATELSTLGKPGGVSMYSKWPMPYAGHGEIWLTNTLPEDGATVEVAYEVVTSPKNVFLDGSGRFWRDDEEVGYFHGIEFNNRSPSANSPHPDKVNNDVFARLEGRGNYVGQVFNMRTHRFIEGGPNIPSYMEGDCMFWIDQAPDYKPDVTSTGHEECHDTGAYFQGDEGNPAAGITKRELAGDGIFPNFTDETSIYHYYVGDAIGFQESFLASIEHGAENSYVGAEQQGVAFYYLAAR